MGVAPVVPVVGAVVGEQAAVGVVPVELPVPGELPVLGEPLAMSISLEFLAPLSLCLASWGVVTCYLVCVALLRLLHAQHHTAQPRSSVLCVALPSLQHALHHAT